LNVIGGDMADNLQGYLTVGAAARFLGVSAKTLREWDRAGKLKPIRNPMNRYRLYLCKDLEAFLQALAEAQAVRG
jgi:DNA-binding transcriptional MerR regulator